MRLTMTIEVPVSFPHPGRGTNTRLPSSADSASLPPGRVPRVARPMGGVTTLAAHAEPGAKPSPPALRSQPRHQSGDDNRHRSRRPAAAYHR
jgi:hypothetical protein